MASLNEKLQNLWKGIKSSPAQVPLNAKIPTNQIFPKVEETKFNSEENYFMIRVNELYLSESRKWFNNIDPMVFFISEFNYDGKNIAVPYVIGPGLIEKYGKGVPEGMIFSNTKVAGLYPYTGGGLTMTAVLYENTRKNHIKQFLGVIENVANAIDFSNTLSQYLKIGDVVVDGLEALLGLGDTKAVVGYRKSFNQNEIAAGSFVLINKEENEIDFDKLWVIDDRLCTGENKDTAVPFREADFVLYSVVSQKTRNDINALSFYPLFESMIESAIESDTEKKWSATKAEMMTLAKEMRFHPDLSTLQYKELYKKYIDEMLEERQKAIMLAERGKGDAMDNEAKDIMNILDL